MSLDLIGNENEEIEVASGDFMVMSEQLWDANLRLEKLSIEKKTLEETIEGMEIELIKAMNAANLRSFRTDKGLFSPGRKSYFRCADQSKAFGFLRQVGCGGLIKETVNTNSLSSEMKKLLEEGTILLNDLPENGITSYDKEYISIRGRK